MSTMTVRVPDDTWVARSNRGSFHTERGTWTKNILAAMIFDSPHEAGEHGTAVRIRGVLCETDD